MNNTNIRFKINTLIQMARLTDDEMLREKYVEEAENLLNSISENQYIYQSDLSEDKLFDIVEKFSKNKEQLCVLQIWKEALGKKDYPRKWQSIQINNALYKLEKFEKISTPFRFENYGMQRGFRRIEVEW